VYGGTAADNELNGGWRVITNSGAQAEGVSLVAIVKGKVKLGTSMIGPYTPTAKTVKVTKAEGRRAFELDGKPAADWVFEWLGDDVKKEYEEGGLILPQTAQKPIGIKQAGGEYVSSHLAALGGSEKWVDFFSPVATGDELVVMDSGDGPSTGYASTLVKAYDDAKAAGGLEAPKAAVLYYCGGMAIAVGDNLGKAMSDAELGKRVKDLPLIGLTVFGEQTTLSGVNVQRNLSLGMALFE